MANDQQWWKEQILIPGRLFRIDYDILTRGFNVMLYFAHPSLRWARVRSRWESKHRCPKCGGAGGWCNFCGEAKCHCPPEGGYNGWRSCDLCHDPREVGNGD